MLKEKCSKNEKKMKFKRVKNSLKNEESYEIESVDSPSKSSSVNIPVSPCDRPGITVYNQRNILQASINSGNPVSPKKSDFIRNWLMKAETERNETLLSTSHLSSIENSPPIVKRSALSPLHQWNEPKRRRLPSEVKVSPKKSEIQKENHEKIELTPRSRVIACRLAIFGSNYRRYPRKIVENSCELIEENGLDKLRQLNSEKPVILQCESIAPKELDIESTSSIELEDAAKIIDDDSMNSSQKTGKIESQSSGDEEQMNIENEDDGKSNPEETLDQLIEDPEGDFPEEKRSSNKVQRAVSINSHDSDRTYFPDGIPINRKIQECSSQKISDLTLTPSDSNLRASSILSGHEITVDASPPPARKTDEETHTSINFKTVKRKRKPKKGSMLERLHTLINRRISDVNFWRHRKAQTSFSGTCNRYVMIKILKFSIIYGRPVFKGVVIKDNHNLIDKSMDHSSDAGAGDANNSINRNITVLTIPEIVGQVNVRDENLLKIYDPWEVIDANKLILSVLQFDIISDTSDDSQIVGESMDENIVIKEFNCCCLKNGKIMNSCCEKFINSKPTAIDFIF